MKISKRKDRNLWYASVKKPTGGYERVYGKTKKEVREKYNKLTQQFLNNQFLEKNNMTVSEWSAYWLENYLGNIKWSTKASYKGIVKNHIEPILGKIQLQKLRRGEVQQFINGLTKNGYSSKSVKNIHLVLHRMLRDALSTELIVSNPADNIIMPKLIRQKMNILNEDEISRFIEVSNNLFPEFTDVYVFLLQTGLRISEFLALTEDRYDREHSTLLIDRQINKDNHYRFVSPKHDVIRTISLTPTAVKIIEERLKENEKIYEKFGEAVNPERFIFMSEYGDHYSYHMVHYRFKVICEEIKKPDLRLHDLRHTFATLALKSGIDIKTLQELLGHSDASFTLNRYGHSTDNMKQVAADKFESMFTQLVSTTS